MHDVKWVILLTLDSYYSPCIYCSIILHFFTDFITITTMITYTESTATYTALKKR